MKGIIKVYNSLSRKKEVFEPVQPPFVGMYVCGPTVYNDVHLGNVRTFISFDVINRYLRFSGYKVRYVRNITDVGHLTDDDSGEDKISKRAKLEDLEPMEIAQKYTVGFRGVMSIFNALSPDIEPSATGHIVEQIEMIKLIIKNGFAYEVNGSVYFDVGKYNNHYEYGGLSGRKIHDLLQNTRVLEGQEDKRNSMDFALWKKATKGHIMQWASPWGSGFPGWHLECSVMSTKYLGGQFDIHGGGMDLKFPHHECEMAQCKGSYGTDQAKYWIHTNMLTVNGTKMSKSLGNSFLPLELIEGNHPLLERGYSAMTIRFLMLQTHYTSTLDFSNHALNAAQKGWARLNNILHFLEDMVFPENVPESINERQKSHIEKTCDDCWDSMNDDFNTALTLGHIFTLIKKVNSLKLGQLKFQEIGLETFNRLKGTLQDFSYTVLGLRREEGFNPKGLLDILITQYKQAKIEKDYPRVDKLRTALKEQGISLQDMKSDISWSFQE